MKSRILNLSVALFVVMGLAGLAMAQSHKSMTLTGNIVDKACSARVAKAENPQAAAAEHKKGCSLMDNCAKSGFGVYADGKYYEFDEKGNELAKAALQKSAKDKGAKFKVVGAVHEGKVSVESITELD